jgi:DNA-binding transcriptional LysR family regulator
MITASLLKRLDLATLRLLIAVDEEKTLTRAAKREAIAVSAASKRLADLEGILGVELFLRQATGMVLTAAGETLLHHAQRIMLDVEKIGVELTEHARGVRGYVRMLANLSAIVQFLPEDLENFLSHNEMVRIHLEERPSGGVVEGVEQGRAEIGICSDLTDSRDLEHFPYRRDRLIVVMRPDHPLATRTELSFDDTLDFDHVGLHVESSIYLSTRQAARLAGRPLKLRIHVPGFDSVCRMVQANMGIGIIPDRAFAILGPALNLHALRLTDDWAARLLKIIIRDERSLSPVSRLLFDHLLAR